MGGSGLQGGFSEGDEAGKGEQTEREKKENWRLQNYDRTGLGGLDYDYGGRTGNIHKKLDNSRWTGDSDGQLSDFAKNARLPGRSNGYLLEVPKRYDPTRWGKGSDSHLYDFAKRFDSSRWGGGSDGHLYDFTKRWGGSGSDGHFYNR